MRKSSILAGRVSLLFFFAAIAFSANAANYLWNGTGNWSNTALWSGGPPATLPGANDSVYFMSGTCNLNMNITVAHFEFDSGFSGEFNQNAFSINVNTGVALAGMRAMVLNGTGTFNGSDQNITLGRILVGIAPFPVNSFVLNGATFNSTSDTFTIQGDFRYLAGTFNHEDGWVRIRGLNSAVFMTGLNPTFRCLEFESLGPQEFHLDAAMDVIVLDTLLKSSPYNVQSNKIMNGDINLEGDLLIDYDQGGWTGFWAGSARIFINGAGRQSIVGRQATFSYNTLENIYIDKLPADTLYLINYLVATGDWHYLGGTINSDSSTVFFFGRAVTPVISGTHTLANVRFGFFSYIGTRTIQATDILIVSNHLMFDGDNNPDIYGGTIHAKGDITVTPNITTPQQVCGGTATIVINGTGPQLFHGQTRRNRGFLPNIVIDKPSGTLTLKDTIVVERSWTYIRGTVDALAEDSYVNFVFNGDGGPLLDVASTIDGEGTSATMLFNNVGLDNPNFPALPPITRNLGGDLRVNGVLNVRRNRLVMNANDIFIENPSTTSIQNTTGYIVSETTPAPGPGLSRIHRYIHNAPMGNTYTFPFGTIAGNYIPTTYTVQTPGASSSTGSISIATYPTDPVPAPNNRPLPPGISHLKSFIGAENAARELDRFWVYECNNYTTSPTATLIFSYRESEWNSGSNAITESLLRAHQWNPGTQLWDQPTAGATPVNTVANLATVGNVSTCSAFTLVDPTLPDLLFEASDTLICGGEQVTFTDLSSSPPQSYSWIFPGGSPGTSAAASPVITYNTPGAYNVILEAVYDGGTLRDTFFNYIQVGVGLNVTSAATNLLCNNDGNGAIDLTITGGNGGFTYLWNDSDTTEERTGLSAGTYTVTVTDSFGCRKIDTSVITQPPVLDVTITNINNTLCSASCNGQATATVSGGTPGPGYDYLWSPSGETTQTAVALCPVAHIVTVTDDNGCTDTAHVTIIGSPALSATITNVTGVSCVGQCDGAITVSASGGTGAGTYTYDWDCTAPNTATVTGLCTGLCTVTVTDGNNCTVVIDTLVPAPAAISLTIHKSDALCNGADDGSAWVVATGGTGALTYDWDGGTNQTNDTVINLPPGPITVVVEDTRGCTATADTVINEPSAVTITSINKTDVSCFNGEDGTATAVVTGGTPLPTVSYTYTWSPAQPDDDQITGLEAGVYTLIAADANGCKDTSTVTVNEPADLVTTLAKSDVSCLGGNDGCAWVVSVTGGTGAPTFSWNNGASTNDTICNRPAGLNTVIVEDANNCTDTASITIGEPATGISLTMTKTDISCFGANDGEAGVNVSGGTGLDSIIWSKPGVIIAPGDSITGLDSGFIRVTAVDNNGCTRSDSVEIIEPDELVVSVVKTDITCFGANDGTLTITVTGGTPGYSGPTLLPSVGTVNGNTVTDLPPGLVCVTYSDASACSDSMCVTILEPVDIVLVLDSTGVSCNGGSDGVACVTASGGAGGFDYNWSAGIDSANCAIDLPPGPVSVTVTDNGNCTKVGTTTITEPAAMVLLMGAQDLTCNGSNDGSAWVTVTGGNTPYTFVWSRNNVDNDTVTGLAAGSISVTVTDSTGCTATNSIIIDEPSEITITEAVTSVICVGGSTGAINVVAAGGSPGYTFLWSDGSANQNLTGASEGFYSVIVTDASNCTASESFTLLQATRFEVTANVINATCGSADGEINVTVSGGTGTLNYIWSDGSNTNQDRTGLTGGTYTVTVTDATPCSQTLTITVEEVGGPAVTGVVTDATTCAATDGAIDITATGGSTVYSYEWNDAILVADRTGLTTGTYTVTVTDDTTGCISISTFDVGAVNGITLSGTSIAATCGGSNGSVTLTISLATPPYSITWSNGAITQDLTGVGAGAYSVTVTDNGGCTKSDVFTVSETGGVAITGTPTHVTCFGAQNGSITLTAAGVNDYLWSNGATTKDITGLKPGIYAVTVNDTSSRCSTIEAFEITEPDAISVVADRSNISCNGVLDGGVDITVSGGTGAYTYSWTGPSFTASTEDISGRGAGTYNVTVSDGNTCVSTLAVTLTEPGSIDLTLDTQSVRCGGDSNGVAWVIVTGGVPDFDYAWSRGTEVGVGDSVINLETGMIRVTVTDANNCSATDSILVPEPTPLTLTLTKTDITCFGADDGTATANPGGGTPPYTFVWDRGSGVADPTVTALSPGPVVVLVTDSNACPIFDTITIVEPDSLTLTVTGTDVSCFGGNDGTAQVTVTGGRAPYTYAWSAGVSSTTASVTGLLQGVVYVTVTDSSLCTKVDSFTIAQPATPVTTTMVVTNVSCFGDSTGSAIVTPAGGTPGYTYSWDRGGPSTTDSTITGLWVGNAIVTVRDSNNCEVKDTAVITQPTQITLVTSKVDISCFGANDGEGTVVATGGTPRVVGEAYDYLWSSGTPLDSSTTTGLSAGTFTVTVSDSLNCQETGTVTIIEPDSIQLTITKVDISCFGLTDGEATVTALGGSGGFIYAWSTTPVQNTQTATGLSAGLVTVTVTDSRNCADSISTTIVEPDSILLSITSTNVSCFGGNNGTAEVTASGGTPLAGNTYLYDWTVGVPGNTNAVTQLPAGQTIVTVTDARGCQDTISANITQPLAALTTTVTKTDVSCFNGNDGTALVTAAGGTPGYDYDWDRGTENDSAVADLTAGIVRVTVTDANGCIKTDSVTLIQPDELLLTIAVDSNASCNGGADGGLTVSLTGGTADYVYHWSNGSPSAPTAATSNSVAGLAVNTYTVTVTDANSCSVSISEDIVNRPGPQINSAGIVLTNPTCDQDNGAITLSPTSTDMPITYAWVQPGLTGCCPTGLPTGTYTVTISDRSTCDTVLTINLQEIPRPIVDFVKIKDSYCDDNDGQATAIVTSGVLPYRFEWIELPPPGTSIGSDSIITGLEAGIYSLVVGDANGCDTTITFDIQNIASPNAAILPASPQTIFEGQTIELFATADVPNPVFSWEPSEGLSCIDCDTPVASPDESVTYTLVVVDSSTQCVDTAYMTIIVKDEDNIFVPNVITPNGDGVNDFWRITELQEIFLNNELVIVNRWGDEIFRSKNYQNDFDGTYKNNKLPDGTYYYIIKLNDINKTVSGPITIISE